VEELKNCSRQSALFVLTP